MYIIIAGCGKVGVGLAKKFLSSGNDNKIVIIDKEERAFRRLKELEGAGIGIVVGDCLDDEVLKEANIEQADCLIGTTDSDSVNLMFAQIGKEKYKKNKVIAKVNESKLAYIFQKELEITTVCPTDMVVNDIIKKIYE